MTRISTVRPRQYNDRPMRQQQKPLSQAKLPSPITGAWIDSARLIGMQEDDIIRSDPEVLSGAPVFARTRVPLSTLFDYIEAGDSLAEFLEDFPA